MHVGAFPSERIATRMGTGIQTTMKQAREATISLLLDEYYDELSPRIFILFEGAKQADLGDLYG